MLYYVSKPVLDTLKKHIESNYQVFLSQIASASGCSIKPIAEISIGNDYRNSSLQKPFILIDPDFDDISYESYGVVETTLAFDVLFAVQSYSEKDVLEKVCLYKDAFISMVLSDDFLGGGVAHAFIDRVDHFPGGSSNEKYVLLMLKITYEQRRD